MNSLSESEFNHLIDETLLAIEEAVDASGADIDYENAGGVLTLFCASGSQLILNRQTPLRQLWLAARSGGYHFDWDGAAGQWRLEGEGRPLAALLAEMISTQCGEAVSLAGL